MKVLPAVSYYNRGKISIDHPAQGGPFNNTTVEVVGVFCRGGLLARGKCAAGKAHNRVVGGQSHSVNFKAQCGPLGTDYCYNCRY